MHDPRLVFVVLCALSGTPSAISAAEPQRWALLVGVNDYVDFKDLAYAGADAVALGDSLAQAGFDRERIFLLHDDAKEARYKPFKSNIEKQLQIVLKLAGPDDLVIVSFSGHGMHVDGKSFLCPSEADDTDPVGSMIAVDDVYKQFDACQAALKLMVVDACRDDPRPPSRKSATPETDRKNFGSSFERPPDGIVVLASCGAGQKSYEDEKLKHGVFMHYVLQGLSGEADGNKNGRVTLGELYDYASGETKLFVAKAHNDYQVPAQRGEINGIFELPRSAPPAVKAPLDAATAQQLQTAWAAHHKKEVVLSNSLGMKLAFIPAGEFDMGSPAEEPKREDGEARHHVKITKPFYLGVYEVMQSEYESVMSKNPSCFSSTGVFSTEVAGLNTSRFPVENVTWDEATEFSRRLSAREGKTYRLPTEAEWEYACRAGTTTAFNFGPELTIRQANFYRYDDDRVIFGALKRTASVGGYTPNAWGLHDMQGNVYEWCHDWYGKGYYGESPVSDPTGPATGYFHVSRGGNWSSAHALCRSAYRDNRAPDGSFNMGFRVALVP